MIVLPQKVKVKWHPKYKEYYESRGYIYTKMRDEFEINVLDLKSGSRVEIKVRCEYCQKELMIESKTYSERTRDSKYSCNDLNCINLKKKENCLKRNGYEHTSQIPEVKEKLFNTNLKKYGNKCSLQGENVKLKAKKTLIKNYGVDNPQKSKFIQEKTKKTNIERYGVPYLMQNKEINELAHDNIEKLYGYRHALQNPEIQKKIRKDSV